MLDPSWVIGPADELSVLLDRVGTIHDRQGSVPTVS